MRKLTPDSLASTNLGEVIWTNNRPKDLYIKDRSEPGEGKKIFWDLTPTYPKLHSCETNFVIGGGLAGHLRSPLWLRSFFVGFLPPLVVHWSQIIHLTDSERYQICIFQIYFFFLNSKLICIFIKYRSYFSKTQSRFVFSWNTYLIFFKLQN